MLSESVHFGPCEHYDEIARAAQIEVVCPTCREHDAALENTIRELRSRLEHAEIERELRIRGRIKRAAQAVAEKAIAEGEKR